VILTKNEEKNIVRCLESLDFCDEVIAVDDFSEDKTVEKIKNQRSKVKSNKTNIKIYQRELNGDFAGQRNFAMGKASNEWVLFIDADEEATYELQKEIKKYFIDNDPATGGMTKIDAFYLRRRDFFWGRELKWGETVKVRDKGLIRLVKKNSGKWEGNVHEEYKVKSQKSKVKSLNNYLNHYPHQSVREFLQEINFYSSVRAKELFEEGKRTNIFEIIFLPPGKFLLTYFIKLGFLDGPAGFSYAFMMSFHSFLVRSKLYLYNMKHEI